MSHPVGSRAPRRRRTSRVLAHVALWVVVAVMTTVVTATAVVAAPIGCLASFWPATSTRCVDAHALEVGDLHAGLDDPTRRDMARMLVSSAENSSLRWEDQYGFIEYNVEQNDAENRGYTAGIVGFTSRTHDMLALVEAYEKVAPGNPLSPFLGALRAVDGTPGTRGLGEPFVAAWRQAAQDPAFQSTQLRVADAMYYNPAIELAKADGLQALGQFVYVDAMIMHGPGHQRLAFHWIREQALMRARPVAQGGEEGTYLAAFLDVREEAMRAEIGHQDTTRVSTGQRRFLQERNFALNPPLAWSVYGDEYAIMPDTCLRCLLHFC